MAIKSITHADFGSSGAIPAGGEVRIDFPTTCSSITFYLGTNVGDDFEVMLNEDEETGQGPTAAWDKQFLTWPAGIIMTIRDYRINSITLRSTAASTYTVWAFVSPSAPAVSYHFTT